LGNSLFILDKIALRRGCMRFFLKKTGHKIKKRFDPNPPQGTTVHSAGPQSPLMNSILSVANKNNLTESRIIVIM